MGTRTRHDRQHRRRALATAGTSGSLLAGKPYPTQPPPGAAAPETPADDKLDQILFALRRLEGQVQDLRLTLDELKADKKRGPRKAPPRPKAPQ